MSSIFKKKNNGIGVEKLIETKHKAKGIAAEHIAKYHTMSDQYPFLECDGLSNVIAFEMVKGAFLPLHNWIEVKHERIDFRLRIWFGETAPHGNIVSKDVDYFKRGIVRIPSKQVIEVLKLDTTELLKQVNQSVALAQELARA